MILKQRQNRLVELSAEKTKALKADTDSKSPLHFDGQLQIEEVT